jgi:hypothetical protein
MVLKSPEIPLVQRGTFKGNTISSPLWKRGVRGDLVFGAYGKREKTFGIPYNTQYLLMI